MSRITAGLRIFYRRLYFLSVLIHHKQRWPLCAWNTIANTTSRGQFKRDGTRAETRFRLSAKRMSLFKSAGASVQSTTGSRGVRISGCNAGYTMFRSSVKSTGYPLHSPVSPFTSPPVCHRVPSHFNWSLPQDTAAMVLKKALIFRINVTPYN